MQEPCKSCERRELDFGGCRCQALLLAGDADGHGSGFAPCLRSAEQLMPSLLGVARRRDVSVGDKLFSTRCLPISEKDLWRAAIYLR